MLRVLIALIIWGIKLDIVSIAADIPTNVSISMCFQIWSLSVIYSNETKSGLERLFIL